MSIGENLLNGSAVYSVVASDADGDLLNYHIISGNESGAFSIDAASGAITVADASPLDYEVLSQFY